MSQPGVVSVREVAVPSSADDADLRATVDIMNAVDAHSIGSEDLVATYDEALAQWQPTPYTHTVRLLAEVDGTPVGRGYIGMPLTESPDRAYVNVWVLPSHRRRGVGSALLRRIEAVTAEHGRSKLWAWSLSPSGPGPLLGARTGHGGVPVDAPGARFATAAGFVLQQVERTSRLDVSGDHQGLAHSLAEAQRASSPAYRVLTWTGFTPPERLDDMAWMSSRMSTDAPHGDIAVDEEVWDAERVRSAERLMASDDRYLLTAAAEHIASGRLVAYTLLTVPRAAGRVARQEDTLVTAEHRGHRLGLLVKAANLLRLTEQAPGVPAVYTWNAEENHPMLDVNDQLGFVGVGVEGQWERAPSLVVDGGAVSVPAAR
ncbi:MAG: GNAT family N-acetyltransferase [Lapillicoccus sp.]